jgi:hypothetical protein
MLGNTHQNLTGTLLVMEGLAGEYFTNKVTNTLSDGIQTQLCGRLAEHREMSVFWLTRWSCKKKLPCRHHQGRSCNGQ